MVRVLLLAALICAFGIVFTPTEASAAGLGSRKTTTSTTPVPLNSASDEEEAVVPLGADDVERYHPAEVTSPRVLEQMDRRFLDGNFEYKFTLSNGVSRYEKSYWTPVGSTKQQARKGYYSHPLPNNKYLTVFYTADENGFHKDSSSYTDHAPVLPRNLDVPVFEVPPVPSTTWTTWTASTTRKPKPSRTTRKPWATTNYF